MTQVLPNSVEQLGKNALEEEYARTKADTSCDTHYARRSESSRENEARTKTGFFAKSDERAWRSAQSLDGTRTRAMARLESRSGTIGAGLSRGQSDPEGVAVRYARAIEADEILKDGCEIERVIVTGSQE